MTCPLETLYVSEQLNVTVPSLRGPERLKSAQQPFTSESLMKVLGAEFTKSCGSSTQYPAPLLPELAVVGRSNVGKSSLINSLLNRKHLAKVSKTPGKTRAVNFFTVRTSDPHLASLYLVDLPGYGYAKVSKSIQVQWAPLIEQYLVDRPSLNLVVLLIESRVRTDQDVTSVRWIQSIGRPLVIVLTKVDKLRRRERDVAVQDTRRICGVGPEVPIVLYSAETHEGRDALWGEIRGRLKT
ncbi:MAG TPA: ribosome biogenesis GTP-binding protein YihA/YsxC [Nitrospiraceae bacterium]|nr:ribosome biogenesis GTP-binding protein YihA/YsxC [Nitrospiraceae bacterium]